jgi:hypothetical protein
MQRREEELQRTLDVYKRYQALRDTGTLVAGAAGTVAAAAAAYAVGSAVLPFAGQVLSSVPRPVWVTLGYLQVAQARNENDPNLVFGVMGALTPVGALAAEMNAATIPERGVLAVEETAENAGLIAEAEQLSQPRSGLPEWTDNDILGTMPSLPRDPRRLAPGRAEGNCLHNTLCIALRLRGHSGVRVNDVRRRLGAAAAWWERAEQAGVASTLQPTPNGLRDVLRFAYQRGRGTQVAIVLRDPQGEAGVLHSVLGHVDELTGNAC